MEPLKLSTARTRMFFMVDSVLRPAGKTGATVTVTLSKDGGSFGAAGGTVTEVSSGWYKIALTTTDTGTLGDLAFHCTASGADPTDFVDYVEPLYPDVNVPGLVLQRGSVVSGAAGSATLDTGPSANFIFRDSILVITAGTGAGQSRIINQWTGGGSNIASVRPNWDTQPDGTSKYVILASSEVNLISWRDNVPAGLTSTFLQVEVSAINGDDGTALNNFILDFSGAGQTILRPYVSLGGGQVAQIATLTNQRVFTLAAGSTDDHVYDGAMIIVHKSGSITRKAVGIVDGYVGSTKQVTLASDPGVFTIAVGDLVTIHARGPGDRVAHSGTMQAGSTSTTAVLDTGASAKDDYYREMILFIHAGTGTGQVRPINSYVGATRTATVDTFDITPDATSKFLVCGF